MTVATPAAAAGELAGKVSLVTGAGKADGMGFAACRKLVLAGSRVVLTDLATTREARMALEARAGELGEQCAAMPLDVTSAQEVNALVATIEAELGPVDVLVNNAGTPVGAGDFLTLTEQAWDQSFAVNVLGMVYLCRAVIPGMQARRSGAIVNNASLAGLGAVAGLCAYTASKFAVVGLTKALASEFGGSGIRVNAVCPGLVWTEMGRAEVEHMRLPGEDFDAARRRLAEAVPAGRWARPEEVGDAVVFLASERASYVNGVALPVAGGLAPGL